MKQKLVKLSIVTAMLLTTGSYAAQIVGSDALDTRLENTQFGYGGLNMDNINVNLFTSEGNISADTFDEVDGTYTTTVMYEDEGAYYQSDVFSITDPTLKLGYVTGKTWPISEPMGIKVVNNDIETNKYKPNNCIMATSYLGDENTSDEIGTSFLTDDEPKPTLCSSYAGSSKRFQLVINENMVEGTAPGEYGKHIDLVFNIDPTAEPGDYKYQVFQKVTNHTGMRLDGMKIEVLNANGEVVTSDLNISLGIGEGDEKETGDIWEDYEIAFYPPGLWGDGSKEHLPIGWFDVNASGYLVSGHGTETVITGERLNGNYVEIYGNWLPAKWVGVGMHEDLNITGAEPVLLAYWGTTPDQANDPNAEPAWYYGMYNYKEEFTNFAPVPVATIAQWATDTSGKYVIDDIEDLPNLSWNYIVNVGENITDKFIIRFTPKVSVDQTPPSYFEDDGVTRISPPTAYLEKKGIATIIPEPTFTPGATLTVGVADVDLNQDNTIAEEVDVNVTNDSGDVETITLTETTVYSGVFSATLPTVTDDSNVSQDGSMTVVEGTVVTVTYNDEDNGTSPAIVTASTTAQTPPPPPPPPSPSSGGGCTYNPNSKSFDLTMLMMLVLGSLYAFRRRFIK